MQSLQQTVLDLIRNLRSRAAKLEDRDFAGAEQIVRDTFLVARRGFGENSPHVKDCYSISFRPTDGIYNTEHYRNKDAWNAGCRALAHVLHAMEHEAINFGLPVPDGEHLPEEISIKWLLRNVSWKVWLSFIGLLFAAFTLGVTVGNTTLVRELLGR